MHNGYSNKIGAIGKLFNRGEAELRINCEQKKITEEN